MRKRKMDLKKSLLLIVLTISFFCAPGNAAERKKPLPLKELQNPNGPSYVSYPYPKNRNEIIEDLKYAINLQFGPAINLHNGRIGSTSSSDGDKILLKLLEANSDINVTEIEKVKNRTIDAPDEFSFLIILRNKKGNEVARLALDANGSYCGGMTAPQKGISKPLKNKTEALKDFSAFLNISKVKKMERIFMASQLAPYPFSPTWELITQDNSKYYLDVNYTIYKLQREMDRKQSKVISSDFREYNAVKDEMIVYDSLNDKILFLKKIN